AFTACIDVPSWRTPAVRHLVHRRLLQRNVRLRRGVIRWNIRVTAYTLILVTDWCPPFLLAPRIRHAGVPLPDFALRNRPCWRLLGDELCGVPVRWPASRRALGGRRG